MNQDERRAYLIKRLLSEEKQYDNMKKPESKEEQKNLLRSLMNVRMPQKISNDFLSVQDEYLQEEIEEKGITDIKNLEAVSSDIYLWQGDITTLKCGAIVNAANSQMLGCFYPCHSCIDNAIHTFAGIQLRLECAEIMKNQGYDEPTGKAKITKAYNLPCDYVIHTVGPIISGQLCESDCELLKSCYISCLELAEKNKISSIAFCCISTGEFHFPNEKAAEIAVKTVKEYKEKTQSKIEVIFNVFKDTDYEIYKRLLGTN